MENPTYYLLGDHSETIEIDYDPEVISYQELLDVFWSSHRPTQPSWSRQYASIIFYHDETQKRLALESKAGQEQRYGNPVYTEIAPLSGFYLAEDYHQKYQLQRVPQLTAELKAIYPDLQAFTASTAAARLNGYVGGNGTSQQLQAELDDLGLSQEGQQLLLDIMSARLG